jgi:glycosyltransferase involved in cell wall biosynthesis
MNNAAAAYRWIWFHDVVRLVACLDLLRSNQKVIVQSHCPELPSEDLASFDGYEPDVAWIRNTQQSGFDRADVVVLPNPDVRPIYGSLLGPAKRIEYLLSGCRPMVARTRIPLDPACVYYLFLGRRMAIKGFDIVLEAFRGAYRGDPSLRLVLVGGGARVDEPGVIDVGRSEDPGSWIAACDYFVSANRQSYFDLSVMEALSLGTPLIIACTGGHAFFAEVNSPGIVPIDAAEPNAISRAILANRTKRRDNIRGSAANQKLYQENFAGARYRERLESMLTRLITTESEEAASR